jgi:toxin ParE1/3/4
MAERIDKTSLATQDIEELTAYYLAEAGMAVALRFVDHAEHSFIHLAQMPKMGALVGFQLPQHADIRRWHIQGFPRLLILYRPLLDGIQLVRVIDAGRDFHALFDEADVPLT